MVEHSLIALPIVIAHVEGRSFVGFDFGMTDYLGQQYRLVSPYLDARPKHWLDPCTTIETIRHGETYEC